MAALLLIVYLTCSGVIKIGIFRYCYTIGEIGNVYFFLPIFVKRHIKIGKTKLYTIVISKCR